MRILANENIPRAAVEALRESGHDVAWVAEDAAGAEDSDVLKRATLEERIVLTLDKDFGELAFRYGLPATSGVILLRTSVQSADVISQALMKALSAQVEWIAHFSVIEDDRVRMTPLA